ncbi:predicted protein [Cyanophage PSS2]|uniref:fiber Ig/hemolysin n=1 Tax=Cyanophage PSS2 TaxID=658401 RepID=UPI0001B0401A|nr:fiber Ig/hemolysin [Cyanophage PSS2]ACT65630.1 fiber Ig/hemolysin [Cyanophage PSS2]ACY75772.1 predicted protein [Cyanophage PSS2]
MAIGNSQNDNTVFTGHKRDVKVYYDATANAVIFEGQKINIAPVPPGVLQASDGSNGPNNPRIKIVRTDLVGEDGGEYILFEKYRTWFFFTEAEARVTSGTDGPTQVAQLIEYLETQFNPAQPVDVTRQPLGASPNFSLDATSTSIMIDNGEVFGVNTLKAVEDPNGLINLKSSDFSSNAVTYYSNQPHDSFNIDGSPVTGGIADVVNKLNALFTVGPFTSVVISDPYATMVADVGGVDTSSEQHAGEAIDPAGNDISTGGATQHYNKYGWLVPEEIDQAGEYYTFDIRGEGEIGFGLVNMNGAVGTFADPSIFCDGGTSEMGHGMQFIVWFGPSDNGPRLIRGQDDSNVKGPGWDAVDPTAPSPNFRNSDEGAEWAADNPIKIRVGIDASGYIHVDYLDVSSSTWVLVARSAYTVTEGDEYKLGIKFGGNGARLFSIPKIHLLAPAAPTMFFRYVESPDGSFSYPLFSTEEQAEYFDENSGGSSPGTYHTHVYVDDPTGTTWYMPDTGSTMGGAAAPTGGTFLGNPISWTEITTLTDGEMVPPAFSSGNFSGVENSTVNIDLQTSSAWTTTVDGYPNVLSVSAGGYLQGTLPPVGDTTDYTVNVTRTNASGTSTGSFTLTNTDDAAFSALPGWTVYTGNTWSPDNIHHDHWSVMDYDTVLSPGRQFRFTYVQNGPGWAFRFGKLNAAGEAAKTGGLDLAGEGAGYWDWKVVFWNHNMNHSNWYPTGWEDNSEINTGSNNGKSFVILYALDGYIYVYRNGTEILKSASAYSGDLTLTSGTPGNYNASTQLPALIEEAATFNPLEPPAGFTAVGGVTELASPGILATNSVCKVTAGLAAGQRLIIPETWVEANMLPYMAAGGTNGASYVGIAKDGNADTANWSDINLHHDFEAVVKIIKGGVGTHDSVLAHGGDVVQRMVTINSQTDGYYSYGIQWDGTDLIVFADPDLSKLQNDYNGFARSYTFTDAAATVGANALLDLVIATKDGGQAQLATGFQWIDIPAGPGEIIVSESNGGEALFDGSSTMPTLVAGQTYRFRYDASVEDGDYLHFKTTDGLAYTTGITEVGTNGTWLSYLEFAVPQDVPPLRQWWYNGHNTGNDVDQQAVGTTGSTWTNPVSGYSDLPGGLGFNVNGGLRSFNATTSTTNSVEKRFHNSSVAVLDLNITPGERMVFPPAFVSEIVSHLRNGYSEHLGGGFTGYDSTYCYVMIRAKGFDYTQNQTLPFGANFGWRFHLKQLWTSATGSYQTYLYVAPYDRSGSHQTAKWPVSVTDGNAFAITGDDYFAAGEIGNSHCIDAGDFAFGIEMRDDGDDDYTMIYMLWNGNASGGFTQPAETAVDSWTTDGDGEFIIDAGGDFNGYQSDSYSYGMSSYDIFDDQADIVFSMVNTVPWDHIPGNTAAGEIEAIEDDTAWDVSSIYKISAPVVNHSTTPYTKGVTFDGSGGSVEWCKKEVSGDMYDPLRRDYNSTNYAASGKSAYDSQPWMLSAVWKYTGNLSVDGGILNQTKDPVDSHNRVVLRHKTNGKLIFVYGSWGDKWQFTADESEFPPNEWNAIYIDYDGGRTQDTDPVRFRIKKVDIQTNTVSDVNGTWTALGVGMQGSIKGFFRVGSENANGNNPFEGTIASVCVSTYRTNTWLPDDAQIAMFTIDPKKWLNDYKEGVNFRTPEDPINNSAGVPFVQGTGGNGPYQSSRATQVYLFGDYANVGMQDAYPSIKNRVYPGWSYQRLVMQNMVANDIENISIAGLGG